MRPQHAIARAAALLAACLLAAACALPPTIVDDARRAFDEGRGEEALAMLDKAAKEDPGNAAIRIEYIRQRDLLMTQWFSQAETMRTAGQYEVAEVLYQRILKYDPASPRGRAGLAQIETDKRHRALVASAEKLVAEGRYRDAQETLRPVLVENPAHREARRLQRRIEEQLIRPALAGVRLKPASAQPVSLELRDVTLRAAFDVLSRAYSINFVFDKDVRADQRTSVAVRDTTFEEAVKLILLPNQLQQKVISENTVIVFPNTPAKLREYQELVVKSFYLANADVKQTANMIRTVVKTRDIFVDEKINLLVIKDTPAAIRLAEQLIAAQDLAEPEVMLEVEVLEVAWNRLLELGLKYPDSVAWQLIGSTGVPGVITLPEWLNRGSELVRLIFPNPFFLLTLRQQDGSTSVLANPKIRVKNREKAKIHIGDRVPVITTTAAATGGFVSESVTYLDVGLKLEVEPLIYLEDEVGIKVGLEVSNIVREIRSTSGTLVYQIGTRNANTLLRLHDGETQVLAGLISDEDRRSADRVPGLGTMPTVGRLFSSTSEKALKTQIVLLITPRLVRTLARPDVRAVEFSAGTEAAAGGAAPATPVPRLPAQAPVTPKPAPQPSGSDMVPFGGVKPEASPPSQ
jgi:general secretion pathway protein D